MSRLKEALLRVLDDWNIRPARNKCKCIKCRHITELYALLDAQDEAPADALQARNEELEAQVADLEAKALDARAEALEFASYVVYGYCLNADRLIDDLLPKARAFLAQTQPPDVNKEI